MRRTTLILALGWTLSGLAASVQPATLPPEPMVRIEGLKPISPHVQVIPDNSVPLVPNVGLVIGTRGVLVVDTGLGARNGAAVAAAARKAAPGRQVWLVATHAHPEHDLGAQGFPVGARMIRSEDQVAEKDADLRLAEVFAARSPANAKLLQGAQFRPADLTFKETHDLDLGGVTVRLLALGPAHTGGDIAVWVAADRVLFSGDLAMRAQPSILSPRASLASWARALDKLEALKPAVVVPSHGPMGDADFIRRYRKYLKEIAERTAAAKASGASLEAATETVWLWQAMRDRHPDRGHLAGAVRMAFEVT